MMQSLIPLYCLTGFVGAGKTTALMTILRENPDKKIGVIFTEPAEYLKEKDTDLEQLPNGSVKCICEEEALPRALTRMQEQQPDMVFIEISGLSDPVRIKRILDRPQNRAVLEHYDQRRTICLVDADNFMEQIRDVKMVEHQLCHCHLAVINKADLVSPELLTALRAQIHRVNPECEIASCSFGGFSLELLSHEMNISESDEECSGDIQNPDSIVINCVHRLETEKVLAFIDLFKEETYRIKGFCLFENGWNQIDVVGSRVSLSPCMPHSSSRLIFISKIGHALSQPLTERWREIISLPMHQHD